MYVKEEERSEGGKSPPFRHLAAATTDTDVLPFCFVIIASYFSLPIANPHLNRTKVP